MINCPLARGGIFTHRSVSSHVIFLSFFLTTDMLRNAFAAARPALRQSVRVSLLFFARRASTNTALRELQQPFLPDFQGLRNE